MRNIHSVNCSCIVLKSWIVQFREYSLTRVPTNGFLSDKIEEMLHKVAASKNLKLNMTHLSTVAFIIRTLVDFKKKFIKATVTRQIVLVLSLVQRNSVSTLFKMLKVTGPLSDEHHSSWHWWVILFLNWKGNKDREKVPRPKHSDTTLTITN